jgi:Holliday junction resolvasome RuvABC endonuclease subunit
MRLPVNLIRTDGGTQARASLSQTVVVQYALAMQQGHSFPPVVVFYDGTSYWLADGFHRLNASLKAGFAELTVELKLGTLREAILYALGANASHGLRRNIADKRHAVSLMLKDREWGQLSDRRIAQLTQTSHPLVGKMRLEVTGKISSDRVYTTKYGTLGKMNVSRIGKSQSKEQGKNEQKLPRWLGIDPGLARLRWAVLEDSESMPVLLDYGEIQTASKRPISERLWELEQDLLELLAEFAPTVIAIEKPLFKSEFKSMEGVLEAMGVIHLVCYRETGVMPIHLFSGMWKSNLGDGRAEMEEITETIASLFELKVSNRERLDAIGIAYAAFCGVQIEASY